MTLVEDLRERGYVVMRRLAGTGALRRLEEVVTGIEAMAAGMTTSSDDFVLEAEGEGGWVAWQRGAPAKPGVLRSASRIHVHRPDLVDIAADLGLPGEHVEPAMDSRAELVSSFLWAKPAGLGSEKPWHQDMAFAPPGFTGRNVLTVWIALDPANPDNGCLEFVPGSHRLGLLPHVGDQERGGGDPLPDSPVEPHVAPEAFPAEPAPVAVPLEPGSAVMFDGMIVHRSAPNRATVPRRAVSLVYASS